MNDAMALEGEGNEDPKNNNERYTTDDGDSDG